MSLRDFIVLNKLGMPSSYSNAFLGSGSFSEVFKVKRITDNKIYALKKVNKSPICKGRIRLLRNNLTGIALIYHNNRITHFIL